MCLDSQIRTTVNIVVDPMDKKLLLAMQYCCNFVGLTMPWSEIGTIMGEGISGGAVIQHLAKLRIRMIEQNLPVPPPLKRGGGTRIATSGTSGTKATTSTAKSKATSSGNKSAPKKANKGKKADLGSDDSEEEDDAWVNDDSDAEYGERPTKRAKSNAKDATRPRKMKTEDSEDEVVTPSRPSKRKHQSTMSSPGQNHGEDEIKTEFAAAGANWLSLEDDDASHLNNGTKTAYEKPSKIVSLPITLQKTGMVGGFKEDAGYMNEDENEEGMAGGGVETYADGSHALSNEGINEGWSYEEVEDQTHGPANNVGLYNHAYNTSPHSMAFNEGFADTSDNHYLNSTGLATNGNTFENNGMVKNQAAGQFGVFGGMDSGHFDIPTNFSNQSAGIFPEINHGFGGDFSDATVKAASFGNGDMTNDNNIEDHRLNVQGDALPFQAGNGYGASSNTFGNNFDRPLRFDEHNHTQTVPYRIQTSWPNNGSPAGASNKTSVNQTPADTSAGVDMGAGYFGSGQIDYGTFDDAAVDYSAYDGSDVLFGAGNFDGNLVGGSFFGSNTYGN